MKADDNRETRENDEKQNRVDGGEKRLRQREKEVKIGNQQTYQ